MLLSPFFTLPLRQSFLSSFLPFFLYLIHPALPSYLSFAPSNLPARSPPPPPPPLRIGMMKRIPTTKSTFSIHKIAMDTPPPPLLPSYTVYRCPREKYTIFVSLKYPPYCDDRSVSRLYFDSYEIQEILRDRFIRSFVETSVHDLNPKIFRDSTTRLCRSN